MCFVRVGWREGKDGGGNRHGNQRGRPGDRHMGMVKKRRDEAAVSRTRMLLPSDFVSIRDAINFRAELALTDVFMGR